jgi:hypothetical protein
VRFLHEYGLTRRQRARVHLRMFERAWALDAPFHPYRTDNFCPKRLLAECYQPALEDYGRALAKEVAKELEP